MPSSAATNGRQLRIAVAESQALVGQLSERVDRLVIDWLGCDPKSTVRVLDRAATFLISSSFSI